MTGPEGSRQEGRFSSRMPAGVPDEVALDQPFDTDSLYPLRAAVAAHASDLGLDGDRIGGLVVLASELATNAIRHGGGSGRLRLWRMGEDLFCEVSDTGPGIQDAERAGTRLVPLHSENGRGLWIVRQLSDHVHIEGATVTAVLRVVEPAD